MSIRTTRVLASLAWGWFALPSCATSTSPGAQSATNEAAGPIALEFQEQARRCGVSVKRPLRDGGRPAAHIGSEGRDLVLRGRPADPKNRCMSDWATQRGMIVLFAP